MWPEQEFHMGVVQYEAVCMFHSKYEMKQKRTAAQATGYILDWIIII